MKSKILSVVLSVCLLIGTVFATSACGDDLVVNGKNI